MNRVSRKLELVNVHRRAVLAQCTLRILCVCLALGLLGAARANASVPPIARMTSFAIADFDGDQRPDLASVEPGHGGPSSTDYWIELQLTSSTRKPIRVIAPAGGLLIEAMDVNGDHLVDLVLATAWLKYPVAIFLNDGHGRFSRAAAGEFPHAYGNTSNKLLANTNRPAESVGVPPEPLAGISSEPRVVSHLHFDSDLASIFDDLRFPPDTRAFSHAGRAPPVAARHSQRIITS